MKVLVVGGGIAGLTLGAFLEEAGVAYTIIEKRPTLESMSFVFVLWDNGRDILQKLKLAERMDRLGSPVQNYCVRDGKGMVMREYAMREMSEPSFKT